MAPSGAIGTYRGLTAAIRASGLHPVWNRIFVVTYSLRMGRITQCVILLRMS